MHFKIMRHFALNNENKVHSYTTVIQMPWHSKRNLRQKTVENLLLQKAQFVRFWQIMNFKK